MPDDLSLLDQLEEWLEAQVPTNLHELPYRMLETMERVSNEIFETLNIHGPPSISIPFPPFTEKAPPPPPPPVSRFSCHSFSPRMMGRAAKAHPYVVAGAGTAVVLTVGLGVSRMLGWRTGFKRNYKGAVNDGMKKDAIVILAPYPLPPMLWPLTVSLLKAGYVVLVAVPKVEDAEQLEKRLSGLDEKDALRVLIYDPEDPSTFPPFHRSMLATLALRYPARGQQQLDPHNPTPASSPTIKAFISLYPLNPTPPSQPGALPALPTLLSPNEQGKAPKLITFYPSSSVLVQPDSFASQTLTANHQLLAKNLCAFTPAKSVSVYVGDVHLPVLHSMITGPPLSRRQAAREALQEASGRSQKVSIVKDYILGSMYNLFNRISAYTGFGSAGKEYDLFERSILRLLKTPYRSEYHLGQYSYLSLFLSRLPPFFLPKLLPILPALPSAVGPLYNSVQGLPASRKPLGPRMNDSTASIRSEKSVKSLAPEKGKGKSVSSASSSDHGDSDLGDLGSSIHTTGTFSSRGHKAESESSGPDTGSGSLGDSWVGLDDASSMN